VQRNETSRGGSKKTIMLVYRWGVTSFLGRGRVQSPSKKTTKSQETQVLVPNCSQKREDRKRRESIFDTRTKKGGKGEGRC